MERFTVDTCWGPSLIFCTDNVQCGGIAPNSRQRIHATISIKKLVMFKASASSLKVAKNERYIPYCTPKSVGNAWEIYNLIQLPVKW